MDVQDVNPEEKDENLSVLTRTYNRGEDAKWIYVAKSVEFDNLPNTVIGYGFGKEILQLFKKPNFTERMLEAKQGFVFPIPKHLRITHDQRTGERLTRCQHNSTIRFYHASVLFP
jgi:hypothetical protein